MGGTIYQWSTDEIRLVFDTSPDRPVRLIWAAPADREVPVDLPELAQPLVEVFAVGHGHGSHNVRHTSSSIGERLRYRTISEERDGPWSVLVIDQHDPCSGLTTRSVLRSASGVSAFQSWTEVHNESSRTLPLQAVSSFASGAFGAGQADLADIDTITGRSEWLGENRYRRSPLRSQHASVELDLRSHQSQDARSTTAMTSQSTWSSGQWNPTAAIENRVDHTAWAWQIEHNGAWRSEISERLGGLVGECVLGLFGPTDAQHQWLLPLQQDESFRTVAVSVALASGGWQEAVRSLADQRRAIRAQRGPRGALPVVFNDYMNTLMGDPTTERLVPLIEAAADAGAEYFCIDAGWYDDDGDWWDSVGEWRASAGRFPNGGLKEVVEHIRARGMVPGLWLEPEVIGVRSTMAGRLPQEAFFQRGGVPVVEHGRLHLDLRNPAARAHIDDVVDRLVSEYGVGYFKFDYNITPGVGTDLDAPSPGAGLLDHNRAHLTWLDGVLERHEHLLIENCASGAQRADYAMLSRLHLQSTSDQQNPLLYPPIAASAPVSILPEQAGNWAYPQPEMTDEQIVYTLATGMLGRLYLSGKLDRLAPEQLRLVQGAVRAHRSIRADIARSRPEWPLGLPAWGEPWLALALRGAQDVFLTVWCREATAGHVDLPLPALAGTEVQIQPLFPEPAVHLPGWDFTWSAEKGVLRASVHGDTPSARVVRLRARR